jgi:NAD-dependent DNA ligase
VLNVSWSPSMYGVLKPLVHIKKVELDGVIIKQLTGHNARYILNNKIGRGAIIKITRSGGVIPCIVSVIQECSNMKINIKDEWVWNNTKVDIVLKYHENNENVIIKRIEYLFVKLHTNSIKEQTIRKLYKSGFNTITKLLTLTSEKILNNNIDGIGKKMSQKIEKEIKNIPLKNTIVDFMIGSLCFGFGISDKKIKSMIETIPNIMSCELETIKNKLTTTKGFSDKSIDKVIKGIVKFKMFMKNIPTNMYKQHEENRECKNKYLFTGCRPTQEEIKKCFENDIEIVSTFSKKINYLIVKDELKESSKIRKAKKNNIPIMSYDEFKSCLVL